MGEQHLASWVRGGSHPSRTQRWDSRRPRSKGHVGSFLNSGEEILGETLETAGTNSEQ